MDQAGNSLSPSFAIAIRARRGAVRRVNADLQATGNAVVLRFPARCSDGRQ
jgi:hypothetical protein